MFVALQIWATLIVTALIITAAVGTLLAWAQTHAQKKALPAARKTRVHFKHA